MRKKLFAATVAPFVIVTAALLGACRVVDNWTLSGASQPDSPPTYTLTIEQPGPLADPPEFEPSIWDAPTTEEIGDK